MGNGRLKQSTAIYQLELCLNTMVQTSRPDLNTKKRACRLQTISGIL